MIGYADKAAAVHEALRQELLQQDVIHADETTIRRKRAENPRRSPTFGCIEAGKMLNARSYCSTTKRPAPAIHPRQFLGADGERPFTGYLQVDGYAGYNGLESMTRVGCMAHVRRKFVAVTKALPPSATGSPAQYAEDLIGRLYGIERKIRNLPHRVRYKIRQQESVPLLNELKAWLDGMQPRVTPKSSLGIAIRYAIEQWDVVSRYASDGRLSIDNNIAEREIKSVVIGRKNWLFADSVEGAHTNAIMYSLVQTAKANGIPLQIPAICC